MIRNSRYLMGVMLVVGLMPGASAQNLVPASEPLERSAIEVRNPQGAFMIGADRAGSTIVTVGERGLVLLSDDHGTSWRQGQVPVSTSLTAVHFVDDTHGVAVGHGGVVLGTSDGGESWTLLLDGAEAANLALQAAKTTGDERAIWEAERLVNEGPDKPFLDVLMLSSERVLVVGAYGLAFETRDGGKQWQPIAGRMDNPDRLHFNAIAHRGSRVVLAGEQGLMNLSDDYGATFTQVATPYNGTFFTVQLLSGKDIVAAGLKGNIWHSEDSGRTWEPLPAPMDASFTASRLTEQGELLLANQAGFVFRMNGSLLTPVVENRLPPINSFLLTNGSLLALTMEGMQLANTEL